jgi:hypothetical protein
MNAKAASLDRAILGNHYGISPQSGELAEWLIDGNNAGFGLNFQAQGLPRFLSEYYYDVSHWPVLISSAMRAQFADMVRTMPALICRGICRYYADDPKRFAERYRLPDAALQLLSGVVGDGSQVLVRYDLTMVDGKPKILEANVGSNIGGWQTGYLWPQFIEMIRSTPGRQHWDVRHTSTVDAFFRHIDTTIREHLGARATGNVLIMSEGYYLEHGFDREVQAMYRRILAESGRSGKLLFDGGADAISIDARGRVTFRGEIVDCVLKTTTPRANIVPELSRAHLRRLVYFPDNALFSLLGDKTNFAVLHAVREAGALTAHEAEMVDACIPWSAFVSEAVVEWRGRRANTIDLALALKDDLVLKRGMSAQGKDVFIGRFHTQDEWRTAVQTAGTDGAWLIQEYCRPDRLYAPTSDGEIAEHDAIWGVFGFGQQYGGAWGRLMRSNTGHGVVNCARGAKEFVVLEV